MSTAGADIHPEIPVPHWADLRYLDDDERILVDEKETSHGEFDIQLSRLHSFSKARPEPFPDDVFIRWGRGSDSNFTVVTKDIPDLIAALQYAQGLMTNEPRMLRRDPDVTAELMQTDA